MFTSHTAKLFITIFFLTFLSVSVYTQQPDVVDVGAMHVTYIANGSNAYFTMNVQDQAGRDIVYGGPGSIYLGPLFNCLPCQMPNTFDSNAFHGVIQFNWGTDRMVYFYVANSASDPIGISPRFTWKRQSVTATGRTAVTGRIEIRDQNTIIAIDDTVTLEGNFNAAFTRSTNSVFRRTLNFSQLDYQLDQP